MTPRWNGVVITVISQHIEKKSLFCFITKTLFKLVLEKIMMLEGLWRPFLYSLTPNLLLGYKYLCTSKTIINNGYCISLQSYKFDKLSLQKI